MTLGWGHRELVRNPRIVVGLPRSLRQRRPGRGFRELRRHVDTKAQDSHSKPQSPIETWASSIPDAIVSTRHVYCISRCLRDHQPHFCNFLAEGSALQGAHQGALELVRAGQRRLGDAAPRGLGLRPDLWELRIIPTLPGIINRTAVPSRPSPAPSAMMRSTFLWLVASSTWCRMPAWC